MNLGVIGFLCAVLAYCNSMNVYGIRDFLCAESGYTLCAVIVRNKTDFMVLGSFNIILILKDYILVNHN